MSGLRKERGYVTRWCNPGHGMIESNSLNRKMSVLLPVHVANWVTSQAILRGVSSATIIREIVTEAYR